MTNLTENFNPSSLDIAEEERNSSMLLNIAELARRGSLLVGAGFFSIVLLMGMNIAGHSATFSLGMMMMGFAVLLSILVSILTYYATVKALTFKESLLEQSSRSLLLNNLIAQKQKLLEILEVLQKETQSKGKNADKDGHESKN